MTELDVHLTPRDYVDAAMAIVRKRELAQKVDALSRASDWLGRWEGRAAAAALLLALAAWSALTNGLTAWQTLLAIAGIPVGLALWIAGERLLHRAEQRLEHASIAMAERDLERQIASGKLNMPLGQLRIRIDETGITLRSLNAERSLTWAMCTEVIRLPEAIILSNQPLRSSSSFSHSILVPLRDGENREELASFVLHRARGALS